MAVKYKHDEHTVLTTAQKTKFVTFLTSVWPGTVAGIERAYLTRAGSDLKFTVIGLLTVTDVNDLPSGPFNVEVDGSNYTYRHKEAVTLNAAQTTAFVDFVTDTWTGVPADVVEVMFGRTGSDVLAHFHGTKTVATIDDLPAGRIDVVNVT